jgi:hypothetical protein
MASSNIRPTRSRLTQESIQGFCVFAEDLNAALAKSLPTNLARYKHAAVLAFTWSNDDIGVMPQTDELLKVFRKSYNFVTEKHTLDASLSLTQLKRTFRDRLISFFTKHEAKTDDRHLLIYFYSGHSDAGPTQDQLRLS